MAVVSLRLPDDLEGRLEREARLTSRPRSEIAREAIAAHLDRAERERFLAGLEAAARTLAHDREARAEAIAVAETFLPLENQALAVGEPKVRYRIASRRKRGKRG